MKLHIKDHLGMVYKSKDGVEEVTPELNYILENFPVSKRSIRLFTPDKEMYFNPAHVVAMWLE